MNKKPTSRSKLPVEPSIQSIISPSLEVQSAALELINAAFKRIGITIDSYARVVKDCMDASTKKEILKDGQISVEEIPDHNIRLKGALAGMELQCLIKAKSSDSGVVNNFIDVKALIQQFNSTTPTRVTDGTTKKS